MAQEGLQKLLMGARAALKAGQPKRALALGQTALKLDPTNALALFVTGQAYGAVGKAAAAADAFSRAARATSAAAPGTPGHQLHVAAADNLLLECDAALPHNWIAALHDAPRLAALQAAIGVAVRQASDRNSSGAHVLVCGGLGLEAVMAAQAGAAAVVVCCEGNPLAAALAAALAADSGCAGRVVAVTSMEQLSLPSRKPKPGFDVIVLADALGSSIDWQLLRRQLAGAAPQLATIATVLPHTVHVRGQLVQCTEAVALNEVDVPLLEADTDLALGAANRLLPRPRRSVRLPTYRHTPLSSAATLLSLPLASLLPGTTSTTNGSDGSSAGNCAMPADDASLLTSAAGTADALSFWFEQQLLGASRTQLSSDPGSCQLEEAPLHPHVWQHLQYLDRRQLAAGQAVAVRCTLASDGSSASNAGSAAAAADALQSLSLAGSSSSSGGGSSQVCGALSLQLEVQLQGSSSGGGGQDSLLLPVSAEQAAVAAAVPRYHTSMLNDLARTAAYCDGIAAAMQQADAAAAKAGRPGERPLVLEIGSGSGLLCLLACRAGAQRLIGCERLPELQSIADQLLAANGLEDRVTILTKHSKELTVAVAAAWGDSASQAQGAAGAADLPRRADVLLHEVFGTDPFSEGVVPSLAHAKQHLLRPGAVLAPCRLRVVAAVAASASQHRLLRPPAAVCGGAIRTSALCRLAPRKVDCQVGGPGCSLVLLTEPATVLSVDFAAKELPLADSTSTLLECLPQPLQLAAWMAAQAAAAAAGDGDSAVQKEAGSGQPPLPPLKGAALYAVSWFEYEFPGGACGSTAPQAQRTEHWQQVVQTLEGAAAEAALDALVHGGGGTKVAALLLMAGYRVDRLWFKLEGLAAAAEEDGEDGAAP